MSEQTRAQRSTLPGILLFTLGMLLFTSGNAFLKVALETFSVAQTMMLRAIGLTMLALVLASRRGGIVRAFAARRPFLQMARGGFLLVDQLAFSVAIIFIGLAEMHALYATAPLMALALASPLLGERIGWRKWLAVMIGFAGALIIVKPGTGVFDPASAFALFGALMAALYGLTTRLASHTDTNETSLLYTCLLGAVVTLPFGLWDWRGGDGTAWLVLALALGSSLAAHVCVIRAYALAPASTLQPLSYISLATGTLTGIAVFGEHLDLLAIAGTVAIAAAGLWIAWHEGRKR